MGAEGGSRPASGPLVRLVVAQRARLLLVAVLGGYFGLVAALGGRLEWRRIGVPSNPRWFDDLRSVTSAWECTRRGIAVLPINPCDPARRPANYPRLWLVPSSLGLGQGSTFTLGLIVAGVFLVAAIAVIPTGEDLGAGVVYAFALCSPAAMLGVERGNVDLTLFALLVLAVLVASRRRAAVGVGAALVLLASLLKLFPFFGAAFFARRPTRERLLALAAVATGFLIYVAVTWRQLRAVVHAVPEGDRFSYGIRRVSEWTSAVARDHVSSTFQSYRAWDVVLAVLAVAIGFLGSRPLSGRIGPAAGASDEDRGLDLFWAGASVYCGSYVVGLNFDYRLVFLLMTVPQLTVWARPAGTRAFVCVTLAALLSTLWFDVWSGMPGVHRVLDWWNRLSGVGAGPRPLPLVVLAQLVLFAALAAWLLATRPAMLRRRPGLEIREADRRLDGVG